MFGNIHHTDWFSCHLSRSVYNVWKIMLGIINMCRCENMFRPLVRWSELLLKRCEHVTNMWVTYDSPLSRWCENNMRHVEYLLYIMSVLFLFKFNIFRWFYNENILLSEFSVDKVTHLSYGLISWRLKLKHNFIRVFRWYIDLLIIWTNLIDNKT